MPRALHRVPDALVPQQARSHGTHQRILTAAVRVLTESGYEGFTTAVVSRRAGVSKGTLFQHFPTRERLVVGTTERIMERQRERFRRASARTTGRTARQRVRSAIGLLWKLLREPEYLASLEVYSAARANKKLAQALQPVASQQAASTDALGAELLVSIGVSPTAGLEGLLPIVFYTLEGMAQDEKFGSTLAGRSDAIARLEQLVLAEVAPE